MGESSDELADVDIDVNLDNGRLDNKRGDELAGPGPVGLTDEATEETKEKEVLSFDAPAADSALEMAPVFPTTLEPEPGPVTSKPAVSRPSAPSLDVDDFLADLVVDESNEPQSQTDVAQTDVAHHLEEPAPQPSTAAAPGPAVAAPPRRPTPTAEKPQTVTEPTEIPRESVIPEEAENVPYDEGAVLSGDQTAVFAPEDPEAPPLVISGQEPTAVSTVDPALLVPDESTLALIRKLAGGAASTEAARGALRAALNGENFNPRELPDARSMFLGIARVMVDAGQPVEPLVEAILGYFDSDPD